MRKISVEQFIEVKVFSLWLDLHKIFWAVIKGHLYSMSEFSYLQQRCFLLKHQVKKTSLEAFKLLTLLPCVKIVLTPLAVFFVVFEASFSSTTISFSFLARIKDSKQY